MTVLRWARTAADGTVGASPKVRWARTAVDGTAAVIVAALPDLPGVEPTSTVSVSASLVGGGSADSWIWRRVSGPTIGLNAAGPSASFAAPSVIDGTSVVLGVTATIGGTTSTERTFTVTVLPQTEWWWTGTGWIPRIDYWTDPGFTLLPGSAVFPSATTFPGV